MRAVAHHQPAAGLVALGGEPGDVIIDLDLKGFGQHPPSTLADELINQRRGQTAIPAGVIGISGSRNYGSTALPVGAWA